MKKILTLWFAFISPFLPLIGKELPVPYGLEALSKQWRVDLYWTEDPVWTANKLYFYEVQKGSAIEGPYQPLHEGVQKFPAISDFMGKESSDCFYRVRTVEVLSEKDMTPVSFSSWSQPVIGKALELNLDTLLTEIQEASFRYFYNFSHPVSGLPREGAHGWWKDCASAGSTGMAFFNFVVGIERGFITREQGVDRVLKMLRFLDQKTEKFRGAFPHWIDGTEGYAHVFSEFDDGADLVETAFIAEGLLLAREYFEKESFKEAAIREISDRLWKGIDWECFVHEINPGQRALLWHWSPKHEWKMNLPIQGFNECVIAYVLGIGSPTHPIDPEVYWEGWEKKGDNYGKNFEVLGVQMDLAFGFGSPLFLTHYSYMGLNPKAVTYKGTDYHDIFSRMCLAQKRYMPTRANEFKGYDGDLWGLTASLSPDGYKVHGPGHDDNGTITPTASLSSFPYLPESCESALIEMFVKYGEKLWGPYGFYDAFNPTRDWVGENFIGIDVGPIAPMIENYRTGLCWKYFMKAPEIQKAVKILNKMDRDRK